MQMMWWMLWVPAAQAGPFDDIWDILTGGPIDPGTDENGCYPAGSPDCLVAPGTDENGNLPGEGEEDTGDADTGDADTDTGDAAKLVAPTEEQEGTITLDDAAFVDFESMIHWDTTQLSRSDDRSPFFFDGQDVVALRVDVHLAFGQGLDPAFEVAEDRFVIDAEPAFVPAGTYPVQGGQLWLPVLNAPPGEALDALMVERLGAWFAL